MNHIYFHQQHGYRYNDQVRQSGLLNHNFELINSLTLFPKDVISAGFFLEGINFQISGLTKFLILIKQD